MPDEQNQARESRLTVSQEFSVLQPAPQNAYLIGEADWKRIKRIVREIVPHKNIYQVIGSLCVGVLVACAPLLLTFVLSSSPLPAWAWTAVIAVTAASLVGAGAFFYFDYQQRGSTVRSVQTVLEEIEEIEKNCAPVSRPVIPADAGLEQSELNISSALYGANGYSWMDVTTIVRSKIRGAALHMRVSNAEFRADPVPNIKKKLVLAFVQEGVPYVKEVPEDEMVNIG